MSKSIVQLDASSLKDKKVEGSITIRLKNDDVQFDFSKFFIQSKYLLDKYKYYEALTSIQSEIDELEQKFNINDDSIKYFIEFIEESKVKLPIEHYKDIYTLCEYFRIPQFTKILDKVSQEELFNDLNFTIQFLQDSLTSNDGLETNITPKLEKFLEERINECIKNSKFSELPVPTIFRIVDHSKEKVDQNLLIDFILDSADTRFILFKFVELYKLRDDKVNEFIRFICEQSEDSKKKYLEYMLFNLSFIVNMKNKYDQILKDLNQTKQEFDQTKQEFDQTKQEFDQTKQEFDQTKQELNKTKQKFNQTKQELSQTKKELNECKKELKQDKDEKIKCKQYIIVGGYDICNQLGEKPNNKNKYGEPAIYPPVLRSFNPSSLLSYSIYWKHSVLVMNDGSLKGIGSNEDGRISATLQKTGINDFTDFSIKDCGGLQLAAVSAVCSDYGTLYMFSKSSGNERQLVLCDKDINRGGPVFLDIGNHHPVSLFSGCLHSAAIGSEGEVIFINRDSVQNSPNSPIAAVSLPDGEKAKSVACCQDSVVVLSSNGRVFSSSIQKENSVLNFSLVSELSDQEIICVSGTFAHFLAVSKEGRVFGRGSNDFGKLGLGEETGSVSSFTKISSLLRYEIRAAYAGGGHSLFETREGKILSCGSNSNGQLLLSSGPGNNNVYSPTETMITSGASFCIAGNCISTVFIVNSPPSNTPNI